MAPDVLIFVRARPSFHAHFMDWLSSLHRRHSIEREIGLRTALGASRARLLAVIFTRALVLVGSGVAAGNLVILAVTFGTGGKDLARALPITSVVMLTVGLLACVEPARRALRIQPADALKQA